MYTYIYIYMGSLPMYGKSCHVYIYIYIYWKTYYV